MQHGLAQWLAYLADKPLPILNRTKIEVQGLIDQAQLSITQYAGPVLFDGGFSARLFSHVNRQRVAAGRHPLTTLDNALSHLGQSAFQTFLANSVLLDELSLPEKNYQGYLRTQGIACHAALQAKNWAKQRNVMQPEETQLAALLQHITEMILWCYGEKVMPEIESLCYAQKKNYEQAANDVLGCGMKELGAALSEKWSLPEMVVDGLRSHQDNFTLATGVSLAAELSRIVSQNWYGSQAAEVIQKIAKYKARSEGEIEHRLHLNAVEITQQMLVNGFDAPARLLPLLADDTYIDPEYILEARPPEKQSSISTTQTISKTPEQLQQELKRKPARGVAPAEPLKSVSRKKPLETEKNSNTAVQKPQALAPETAESKKPSITPKKKSSVSPELAAAIKEFQQMVAQARPAHELIEFAVKSCLLCGVQRCVFLIKVPDKNILVSRYADQVSENIAIKALKISLDKPHVFSLLMEKSRNLFLNKDNIGKYWNRLPDQVKLATGVKQFFSMSIFANNHAMGLMYADKVKGELTQEEFAQFQGVCRLLSKGIIQSAHNKKK